MAHVNKPIESRKRVIPEPAGAIINKPFEVKMEDDCTFRGTIRKGAVHGNETFEASAELHQKHTRDFTCLDVLFMERSDGRHNLNCAHVGYWSSKACGCKK